MRSLSFFILSRLLPVVAGIFVLIFLVLDLSLRIYIVTGTREQLKELVSADVRLMSRKDQIAALEEGKPLLGETDAGGPLGMAGNAFILSDEGEVLDILHGEGEQVEDIRAFITGHREFLRAENLYIDGESGSYFISTKEDMLRPNALIVYFLDVTAVMRFYHAVIRVLLLILGTSVLLMGLCARWMARALKQKAQGLSDYAGQIGGGNYEAKRPECEVREFQELSDAMGRMAEKIDDSQKQQIAFFQNVSHELRTPLMSIRCYAEGISCGVMDAKKSSATILDETDQLSGMVEDMLYISRMDRHPSETDMEEADLREILSSCASRERQMAERGGLSFAFHFDDDPVLYLCHEQDMERLCINLISNAIRYARKKILLECLKQDGRILLSVSDDGPGIEEEALPHIFERFYKGKGGVHGIGLSIVKTVAERYGATVRAENRDGARFEVIFPL